MVREEEAEKTAGKFKDFFGLFSWSSHFNLKHFISKFKIFRIEI